MGKKSQQTQSRLLSTPRGPCHGGPTLCRKFPFLLAAGMSDPDAGPSCECSIALPVMTALVHRC